MPVRPEADFYIYKRGVFDFSKLYKLITSWYTAHKMTMHEPVYKDKPGRFGSREINTTWLGKLKVSGYIRYIFNVELKAWDLSDVEVTVDGKKVKKQKTRVRVHVFSQLETDWEGRFGENRFLEKVRNFYEKYIIKKDIETKYEAECWGMTYDLHGKIKQSLEMEAEKHG